MTLDTYKKNYHKNKFQYLLTNHLAVILESDDTLFVLEQKTALDDVHPFFESLLSLFKTKGETYHFSCVNLIVKGKDVIVDISIHNQDGNKNLVVIEDLTNHYNNYQLTAQTRNDSVINSQILELKNKYLLEKEDFKNTFITNFSHQLRNPITSIATFCNIISDTNLSAEQKNYLHIISSANTDLKNRIDDVLDIAKINSGQLILTKDVFSLATFLDEIVYEYKSLAANKNLDFSAEIDTKLPEFIEGDKFRLKQIIDNLMSNAITFTTKGSVGFHISLNYIRANKISLHIEVTDTGIGINPSDYDLVFERFAKIESPIQNDENIGLGLAIVKHLISEMGGNISIESQKNIGTKITCNLSLSTIPRTYKEPKKTASPKTFNFARKQNVLLIDASELTQLSVLKTLALEGNFYLEIVSNIAALSEILLKQEFDIILLSNKLGNHSAEELIKKVLKTSRDYKDVPKLILTPEISSTEIKRLIRVPNTDYIKTPFDKNILLETIYEYLKK